MFQSDVANGVLTVAVLVWFMIACPILCVAFSIFSDNLNLDGKFEKIGASIVSLLFIPIILFFKVIDAITSPFIAPDMKYAIDNRDSFRGPA